MADEGLREIQLSAKQLVFLFITAAVVLVVTFMFGVLVGRGVRAQKEATVAGDVLAPGGAAAVDPTAGAAAPQPAIGGAPAQPPATPPPTPAEEDLSYYSRLESQGKPGEPAKPGGPAPAAKAQKASGDPAAKSAPAGAAATPAATPAASQPPGPGYSLKVAAYKDRGQADALAARLAGKGYTTFVVQLPATKGPGLFSVRVGKFKTEKEADAARRRLEKEEKLKPLLTSR